MQKLIKTALAAATVFVVGCHQGEERQPAANAPEPVAPAPRLPTVEKPMDRAALLQAVAAAASAAGLGRDDGATQRKLDGKTFEVRIRFACDVPTRGSGTAAAPFRVSFDEESRTLKVRASADLTINDPAVAQVASESVEAVEGFWMRRPWLLSDGCPAAAPEPVAHAASVSVLRAGQRVGLAQFYMATDSRIGRRKGRPFEATLTLPANEHPSAQGYNLVLSGRLKQLGTGKVISCRIADPDVPPECLASAEFDHVWIEHPQTHAVIAEWTSWTT